MLRSTGQKVIRRWFTVVEDEEFCDKSVCEGDEGLGVSKLVETGVVGEVESTTDWVEGALRKQQKIEVSRQEIPLIKAEKRSFIESSKLLSTADPFAGCRLEWVDNPEEEGRVAGEEKMGGGGGRLVG